MPHLLALSGSLRAGSFNTRLLRAAVQLAPQLAPGGVVVEEGSIHGVPLYDGDVESEHGLPAQVVVLKEQLAAADGVILVTPEYNHGIPGVFKNAIDWTSRPARDLARVWGGKRVGIIGASPGRGGSRFAQAAWLPVLHALGATVYSGRELYVSNARDILLEDGTLADDKTRELLTDWLAGFAAFCAR